MQYFLNIYLQLCLIVQIMLGLLHQVFRYELYLVSTVQIKPKLQVTTEGKYQL